MKVGMLLLIVHVALAGPQTAPGKAQAGWRVQKRVDAMTDAVQMTAILPSTDGRLSLRVFCSSDGGGPIVFMTIPKRALGLRSSTIMQARFDSGEPGTFVLSKIEIAQLIKTFGGSATADNFAIGDSAMWAAGEKGFSGPVNGRKVIKALLESKTLTVRADMVDAPKGIEGRFQVAGLRTAGREFLKACPAE